MYQCMGRSELAELISICEIGDRNTSSAPLAPPPPPPQHEGESAHRAAVPASLTAHKDHTRASWAKRGNDAPRGSPSCEGREARLALRDHAAPGRDVGKAKAPIPAAYGHSRSSVAAAGPAAVAQWLVRGPPSMGWLGMSPGFVQVSHRAG